MSESDRIYTTSTPFLVSLLGTQKLGLGLYNKPWILRHCDIYKDGRFVVRHKDSTGPDQRIIKTLNVQQVEVRTIALDHSAIQATNPEIIKEIGFHIKCRKTHGLETYFRCILSEEQVEAFLLALQELNPHQSLSMKTIMRSPLPKVSNSIANPLHGQNSSASGFKGKIYVGTQSIMRRAVTHAMDSYIIQDRHDHIVSRRGALKWLPVAFSNDLIHGSWYFAFGSLLMVGTSIVVLVNSYDMLIGDDDSFLSPARYRATWILLIISGVFFTLGSLAFIRAVHVEPPMKPLFKWYHVQNDELVGSWYQYCRKLTECTVINSYFRCFLFGTIPVLPYCMIYMTDVTNTIIYVAGLVVSCLVIFGAYLLVWASYPSDKDRKPFVLPMIKCLCCCCCSKEKMEKHLANDWLAACWLIFYGNLFATIVCAGLFIDGIARLRNLNMFINGTFFFESFLFLAGTAYFVAGSYPDDMLLGNDMDEESQQADYVLVSETRLNERSDQL